MSDFCFIVGVGRSGTSLLQSMLHTHDDIFFTPERQFIRNYYSSFLKRRRFEKLSLKEKIRLISEDKRYANVDHGVIENGLMDIRKEEGYIDKMLSLGIRNEDFLYIGEKDARNIDYLEVLRKIKNSKIIHIYRDPRDVILSKSKAAWSKRKGIFLNILIGRVQLFNIAYNKQDIMEVGYESLLEYTERELQKICGFLGVVYQDKMIDFKKSARELLISDTEKSFKQKNFKDLDNRNFDKWKGEISPFNVFLIECLYFNWMKSKGYGFEYPYWLLVILSSLLGPFLIFSFLIYKVASRIV
jgi:hypothetical protein